MPVERPTFHESWYRVADLHPKLRSTVQITRQHFRGLPWHVVQDHSNNAFFRLAEPAYRFIALLDGKRTVGQAWTLANEQLGDDAPTQGEAIQLLGQLYTSNLLQAEVAADTHTLFARYKKRKQREIAGYFMNIMFARIPILDPDNFLNKWLPVLGWIFAPVGFVVWMVLIAFGVYSILHVPNWQEQLTSRSNSLLSPSNLILLYVAFALIKACHEMGHAISCKKFGKQAGTGGEVHIIGIMLLVFTPVPYVDASSSWALTNKWHRAIVGAAGMWVELAIASVAAYVWAHTRDNTVWHNFSYNIMFVAGFSTIVFNANPLLRYDGYYILSDLLEIPNLAQRGKEYIFYLVKRYVWNVKQARNPAYTPAEKFWLFVYAIASFIMRIFVTLGIMFYLTSVLEGPLILVAAGMTIAGLITWAVFPIGKFIHYLWTSGELHRVRTRAITTSLATIAILVYVVGFLPVPALPNRSRAQGVIEPDTNALKELFPGGDGMVTFVSLNPQPGGQNGLADHLKMPFTRSKDILIKQENIDLHRQLIQLRADQEHLEMALRDSLLKDASFAPAIQQQIDAVKNTIALRQKQVDNLTLTSPLTGILIQPDLEHRQFAYLRHSDRIGVVADLSRLIIRVAVPNDLAPIIDEDSTQDVEIRVLGRPDILLTGKIGGRAAAGSNQLPSPALGFSIGGELNTAPDDQHGTKTVESFFEYRIHSLKFVDATSSNKSFDDIRSNFGIDKDPSILPVLPGQRVVVRFNMKQKPLAVQAWSMLTQVFQKRFQVF